MGMACGGQEEQRREPSLQSPNAKPGYAARQRKEAPDPADGVGKAWLVEPAGDTALPAGGRARFEIVYEAAGSGVAEGGAVYLQVSPHWGWSRPQVGDPRGPGYTEVDTDAVGVRLEARRAPRHALGIHVSGRRLEAGERLRIVYGAGPALARVDRFAEQGSPLWIGVDGNGDGLFDLVAEPPRVDVIAGAPQGLVLLLPSSVRPGETLRLSAAILDRRGNAGIPVDGELQLIDPPSGLLGPQRMLLRRDQGGHAQMELVARDPGTYRLRGRIVIDDVALEAESNPLVVRPDAPRILWADLHGHSQLSDGTGTPEQYFAYARDIAALDVAALTDHDRWGVRFLDDDPVGWRRTGQAVRAYHQPGRFVVLPGYEWTHWMHGHRHVLYFEDGGPLFSVTDPATDTPSGLWQALRGRRALTFAHHSGGAPVATNWAYPPDPELEPVTEITSVHGSSESADTPNPIQQGIEGNFVRDVLERGFRFGFIGSGDSHDGHPGLAHLTVRAGGGLAAILSERHTREGVYAALRARSVYATNGPRIWLSVSLDGQAMGESVATALGGTHQAQFEVVSESPLERVDWIRSGGVVHALEAGGRRAWSWEGEITGLAAGEYLYLRAVQSDGGAAWSSPFYAE
jgi:hypothetical protein